MKSINGIPVVKGRVEYDHGVRLFEFDCPHCKITHTHGLPEGYGPSHRLAHCCDSPYRDKGYYIYVPKGEQGRAA